MSMSTYTTTTSTATVASLTGATKTNTYTHFLNPVNSDEVIIDYNGIALVINKRMWNLLSINAPVTSICTMQEVTTE